jgi:hypothetical protein
MTTDRIALYILALLVVVVTGSFAWYALGNDAAMERLRGELAETNRRLELMRPTSLTLYPKRPDEV